MEKVNIAEKIVFVDKPFAKRIIYQDDNVVAFTLNFKPGQALPPHTHFDSTVVILVHAGTGELGADEATTPLKPGDVVTLRGDERLTVRNSGAADLTLFVTMAPRPAEPRYSTDVG